MKAFWLGLLLSAGVGAVDIPSSATGIYMGGGHVCLMQFYASFITAPPAVHRVIRPVCIGPDGNARTSTQTWNGCPQANGYTPTPLIPYLDGAPQTMILDHYDGAVLHARIDGVHVDLVREVATNSPNPYAGCGAAPAKPFAAYCSSYIGCDW